MTDESASADKTKDKSSDKNDNEDMAEWERRLADGDLPEDFLAVTEPQGASATQPVQESQRPAAATGLLVDIPTVEATNAAQEFDAFNQPPTSKGSFLLLFIHKYNEKNQLILIIIKFVKWKQVLCL